MNRDLGLNHGPGKGDADRTERTKFVKGLKRIKGFTGPQDKTGFTKSGVARWRKSYK